MLVDDYSVDSQILVLLYKCQKVKKRDVLRSFIFRFLRFLGFVMMFCYDDCLLSCIVRLISFKQNWKNKKTAKWRISFQSWRWNLTYFAFMIKVWLKRLSKVFIRARKEVKVFIVHYKAYVYIKSDKMHIKLWNLQLVLQTILFGIKKVDFSSFVNCHFSSYSFDMCCIQGTKILKISNCPACHSKGMIKTTRKIHIWGQNCHMSCIQNHS